MIYKVTIDSREALVEARSAGIARKAGIEAYLTSVHVERASKEDVEWAESMGGGMIIRTELYTKE